MHDTMPISSFLQKERPRTAAFSPAYTPPRYSKSGKLPTHPSPKSTLTLKSHLGQNGRLGKGWVDTFPDSYPEPHILCQQMTTQVQNVSQLKVFLFFGLIRERFESSLGLSWLNDEQ